MSPSGSAFRVVPVRNGHGGRVPMLASHAHFPGLQFQLHLPPMAAAAAAAAARGEGGGLERHIAVFSTQSAAAAHLTQAAAMRSDDNTGTSFKRSKSIMNISEKITNRATLFLEQLQVYSSTVCSLSSVLMTVAQMVLYT